MKMRKPLILICIFTFVASSSIAYAQNPYRQWKYGPSHDENYFPIAVWLQNPSNADQYIKAGFNLYIGLWQGPTESQLRTLRDKNMRVICDQNEVGLAHKDDPIIAGWTQQDEPDNAQPITDPDTGQTTYGPPVPTNKIVDLYEKMMERDPSRPVFLNLGQGVANDEWPGRGSGASLNDYYGYAKGCDLLSFDVYPVAGMRKPDGENYLWYVAKGIDRLREFSNNGKIIWNVLECTHIGNPDKKATPDQVKAMAWMSIIHGSRGLVYFVHQFQPRFLEAALLQDEEMLAAVTELNKQIQKLAAAINAPTVHDKLTVESESASVPVDAMMKAYQDSIYIFSIGMRNDSTIGTFKIVNLPNDSVVEVIGENRTFEVQSSTFQDHFDPYEVHLYKIQQQASNMKLYNSLSKSQNNG